MLANAAHHPNTVRMVGIYEDAGGDHAIVMDYLQGGDLKRFLARHGAAVTTRTRLEILKEVRVSGSDCVCVGL